jgi:hypothetical protein
MTQATVREWDPERGGSAFLADGQRVTLPPECLRDSVFRFLRVGQRVRLVLEGDTVVRVDLP